MVGCGRQGEHLRVRRLAASTARRRRSRRAQGEYERGLSGHRRTHTARRRRRSSPCRWSLGDRNTAQAWITTGDRSRLLSLEPDLPILLTRDTSHVVIDVDEGTSYQEMVGFGAAMTDASAYLIQHKLTPPQREALLRELFGRDPGLGFSFVRVPMGASDFSLDALQLRRHAGRADATRRSRTSRSTPTGPTRSRFSSARSRSIRGSRSWRRRGARPAG